MRILSVHRKLFVIESVRTERFDCIFCKACLCGAYWFLPKSFQNES